MANFLASVGRARPTRNVLDVIQGGIALDQNQRRNQMTAADLAMSAQQLEQQKRQGEYEEQQRQEGETPIAIETLASGFEGGDQGPMFKMVYDMADKAGYIDKSTGGMGTIKKGQMPEIGQMMAEPGFMSKLSRTRIDYWRTQHGQIKAALAEKPTDQKLLQAFQQANTGLNQALGQDKALMDAEKQRLVAEKQDEVERHNMAMESKDKNGITISPDGTVQIGGTPKPATKATQSKIQEQMMDVDAGIDRVKTIVNQYRTDYQELGTRWQNMWTAGKEKFGIGKAPTGEEKSELRKITAYRTSAISNINEEIHRLTGAQMSKHEAGRITKGLPNPGTGFFDGDSPTQFESKLSGVYKNLLKTRARLHYYLNEGYDAGELKNLITNDKAISLDDIMAKVDKRGTEIEAELMSKNPEIEPQELRETVKGILSQEFGLEF